MPWVAKQRLITAVLLAPAILFLGVWFIAPLGQLISLSFSGADGPFSTYRELIESAVYRRVLANTLIVAVNVTWVCIVLAFPTAYMLSRLRGAAFTLAFYCVLFPFWISVLVRTFSWMLVLEKNGPLNRLLVELALVDRPLSLLFNNTGVYIGMVHVLLPYAVLPIYAIMARIDERLLLASDGLGASPYTTFTRVYLPLTMPGVAAAAAFVFLLALGFFITPALLGGVNALNVAMLIETLVNERLVWPLAGAASVLLLVIILALLAMASRVILLGRSLVAK